MNASSSDLLHRFIFENTDIRGEIVSLEQSLQEMFAIRNYPKEIRRLLGEFVAAASLLSSTLKFEGTLTLQARGEGALSLIMAEISHQKSFRGVVEFDENTAIEDYSLSTLLGQGVMTVIIDPNSGERYQGIIEIKEGHLANSLEAYFMQSAQLPTHLWLASDGTKASGMLLQRLPQQVANAAVNDDAWETQCHLASTISEEEQLSLSHETLLTRLFHESELRLFNPEPIKFRCSCSRERSSTTLKRLGKEELQEILASEGQISVDCHFCGYQYCYTASDIDELFNLPTQH